MEKIWTSIFGKNFNYLVAISLPTPGGGSWTFWQFQGYKVGLYGQNSLVHASHYKIIILYEAYRETWCTHSLYLRWSMDIRLWMIDPMISSWLPTSCLFYRHLISLLYVLYLRKIREYMIPKNSMILRLLV